MRLTILCSLLFALAASAAAQDFTHFEVASVRHVVVPPASNGGVRVFPSEGGIGSSNPTRIIYKATWLFSLILDSYSLKSFQLTMPPAISSERYDITANIPVGATREQFNVMIQSLLKERFHLAYHIESKMFPVYAVVVGKNGVKLKESSKEPPPDGPQGAGPVDEQGYPTLSPGFTGTVAKPSPGRMRVAAERASFKDLLGWFGNSVDRPLIDETGLTGLYDVKMEFQYAGRPGAPSSDAPDPVPTVASALEKLGLKLEPKQMPFDVFVIDRLDKEPTDN